MDKLKQALARLDGITLIGITSPAFEDRGTDVSYEVSYGYGDVFDSGDSEYWAAPDFFKALRDFSNHISLRIELKPSVGDDFPAVLRQLKADKSNILVLRTYTGTGASWQEFLRYFASQGIRVVLEAEIDDVVLPEFDRTLSVDLNRIGLV